MVYINKVTLIGVVDSDTSIYTTKNGTRIASFILVTERDWTADQVDYHRIVAWGIYADVVDKHVTKGDALYIEGRIMNRAFDREDFSATAEILIKEFHILGDSKSFVDSANLGKISI